MKKKTKGIIMFAFLGGIMVTSGVVIGIPGLAPNESDANITITGTPKDNFPDEQRPQFCETGDAKSNFYITEYKIPTECTQPLALTMDANENVWFTQANTLQLAKFVPSSESFFEYPNPFVQQPGARSMMWGIDYSPDGTIWFTDETNDVIWKFSIDDETYETHGFPTSGDPLPQILEIVGSKIIINDFSGNRITFLDPASQPDSAPYLIIPSPVTGSFTSDFAVDNENNLWYTNWIYQQNGVLIKFDQNSFDQVNLPTNNGTGLPLFDFIEIYEFPPGMTTPNGVSSDSDGNIWITDTSSSYFFRFDPNTEEFTRFITTEPQLHAYGNSTGLVKTPISRPYWNQIDDAGRVVFNEQTANRIGIFDPKNESLVEYEIPSRNPNWADCGSIDDCGLAQTFGFTINGDKVWFSEWVENNIAVLDTSKPLPASIDIEPQNITIKKGAQTDLILNIIPGNHILENISITSSIDAAFSDIVLDIPNSELKFDDLPQTIPVSLIIHENALSGTYKVIIGAQTDEVIVSQFVTVTIEP